MSKDKHTPEPWKKYWDEYYGWIIIDSNNNTVKIPLADNTDEDIRAMNETADFVHAALNAMQGVDDPQAFVEQFERMKQVLKNIKVMTYRGGGVATICLHMKDIRKETEAILKELEGLDR